MRWTSLSVCYLGAGTAQNFSLTQSEHAILSREHQGFSAKFKPQPQMWAFGLLPPQSSSLLGLNECAAEWSWVTTFSGYPWGILLTQTTKRSRHNKNPLRHSLLPAYRKRDSNSNPSYVSFLKHKHEKVAKTQEEKKVPEQQRVHMWNITSCRRKESSWLQATITSAEMAGAAPAYRGPTGTVLEINSLLENSNKPQNQTWPCGSKAEGFLVRMCLQQRLTTLLAHPVTPLLLTCHPRL